MTFTIRKLLIAMAVVGLVLFAGRCVAERQRRLKTEEAVRWAGGILTGKVCVERKNPNSIPSIDEYTDVWGQKLRSVRVGGGVLVWSVGPDGIDATRDDYWYFSQGNFKGAREEVGYGPRPDWTYVQQTAR